MAKGNLDFYLDLGKSRMNVEKTRLDVARREEKSCEGSVCWGQVVSLIIREGIEACKR